MYVRKRIRVWAAQLYFALDDGHGLFGEQPMAPLLRIASIALNKWGRYEDLMISSSSWPAVAKRRSFWKAPSHPDMRKPHSRTEPADTHWPRPEHTTTPATPRPIAAHTILTTRTARAAMTTQSRIFRFTEKDFILEPVNDSGTKVTHRDRVGWRGINTNWDAQRPYTWTTSPNQVGSTGITNPVFTADTPDSALRYLCQILLREQGKEDSRNINPQERQAAARKVLEEFLLDIPPSHPD